MTSYRKRLGGFTLIEILVALALMAMIATIMIMSLQLGGHTWQRVMRTTTKSDEIAQAQEFLRSKLTSLYPSSRNLRGVPDPPSLRSDGSSMEFIGGAPNSASNGLWHYRVAVSSGSSTLEVRSRVDSRGPAPTFLDDTQADLLLSHVASMTVQFLQPSDDKPSVWVDRWEDTIHMPSLIRIDVVFDSDDTRIWPSLYIDPRVDTPADCEFDVVSRRCRSGA